MNIEQQLKTLNHHAYCIVGGDIVGRKIVEILEASHDIPEKGNPDFIYRKYITITIDDVREIKSIHDTRPMNEKTKKVFVIVADNVTVEAENALLKLFEEPASYAVFFLIVSSLHILLPTLRSRLMIIESADHSGTSEEVTEIAKRFLTMKIPDRLEFIKSFTDDISKEKKTKREAIDLVNAIEKNLYDKSTLNENISSFEAIDTARKYMNDRSPSLKMLFEYLAMQV